VSLSVLVKNVTFVYFNLSIDAVILKCFNKGDPLELITSIYQLLFKIRFVSVITAYAHCTVEAEIFFSSNPNKT